MPLRVAYMLFKRFGFVLAFLEYFVVFFYGPVDEYVYDFLVIFIGLFSYHHMLV